MHEAKCAFIFITFRNLVIPHPLRRLIRGRLIIHHKILSNFGDLLGAWMTPILQREGGRFTKWPTQSLFSNLNPLFVESYNRAVINLQRQKSEMKKSQMIWYQAKTHFSYICIVTQCFFGREKKTLFKWFIRFQDFNCMDGLTFLWGEGSHF